MSARLAATWGATLIGAAAAGWLARGPVTADAVQPALAARAGPALAFSEPAPGPAAPAPLPHPGQPVLVSNLRLPPAAPAGPAAVLYPNDAAAEANGVLHQLLTGSDTERFQALVRARAGLRPLPPQVLQALLFGDGSSGLRLAALELWAESLDADPRAQQTLFEQALQVSDDVVRAEARVRLDETLQRRHRLAGTP